ncbi:MAG: desulfoferrodoxin [Victivallaceae bacterium]|nr:desulfoferrodoxin [Victivallaceae bacterium]
MEENRRKEIFRCSHCGLVVEIMHPGAHPVCCGEPMTPMKENTVDAAKEKHVPVGELYEGKTTLVKVGAVPHPMTGEHFIEWIEVNNGDYVNRKYLKPGDKPEAHFYVPYSEKLEIRAYCNLHGLWKKN